MDNSPQWPQQGIGVVKADYQSSSADQQKRTLARPQKDQIVNCPRCNSVNTKFCYYNNYSLSQPRYFCKTCRRYWTAGGSLRNVPVGGGSRKNRRSSSSSVTTSSSSVAATSPVLAAAAAAQAQAQAAANKLSSSSSPLHHQQQHQGHDLSLSFPLHPTTHDDPLHHHHLYATTNPTNFSIKPNFSIEQLPSSKLLPRLPNPSSTPLLPPMGLFKNSLGTETRDQMMSSLMMPPDHHHQHGTSNTLSSSASLFSSVGFPNIHDQFKPSSLSFSLDGFSGGDDGYASSLQLGVQNQNNSNDIVNTTGARLLFPFDHDQQQQHLNKQVPSDAARASAGANASGDQHVQQFVQQNRPVHQQGGGGDGTSAGFWTGMLSGGSW